MAYSERGDFLFFNHLNSHFVLFIGLYLKLFISLILSCLSFLLTFNFGCVPFRKNGTRTIRVGLIALHKSWPSHKRKTIWDEKNKKISGKNSFELQETFLLIDFKFLEAKEIEFDGFESGIYDDYQLIFLQIDVTFFPLFGVYLARYWLQAALRCRFTKKHSGLKGNRLALLFEDSPRTIDLRIEFFPLLANFFIEFIDLNE